MELSSIKLYVLILSSEITWVVLCFRLLRHQIEKCYTLNTAIALDQGPGLRTEAAPWGPMKWFKKLGCINA